jgi:two-component system cell cycle response regulator DivK
MSLVLVVDDFQDARELYCECLRLAGHETAEASNGASAVQQAMVLVPDVILMDLAMPVMDGVEATRRLKADERTSAIRIIALTGYAGTRHAADARAAGCETVLIKPVLPSDLVRAVKEALGQSPT